MGDQARVVGEYLSAYASGDVDGACSAVVEDFSFRGSMQQTQGREAFATVVAHARFARGHRVLRQWADGADVCTLYELDVGLATGRNSVLVSEWSTVQDGKVASSVMVFDSGQFQRSAAESAQAVDPVCGMAVDAAVAAAHRHHAGHDHYFCSAGCAARFDADPDRFALAPA